MSEENRLEEQYIDGKVSASHADSISDTEEWTAEEEKAVVRKLDWRVVPLVTVLYLLCFIDRYQFTNPDPKRLRFCN